MRRVERTISNAFLAPQIIKAAANGNCRAGRQALMNAPAEGTQQWNASGLQRGRTTRRLPDTGSSYLIY
jgi:hypothetical protein